MEKVPKIPLHGSTKPKAKEPIPRALCEPAAEERAKSATPTNLKSKFTTGAINTVVRLLCSIVFISLVASRRAGVFFHRVELLKLIRICKMSTATAPRTMCTPKPAVMYRTTSPVIKNHRFCSSSCTQTSNFSGLKLSSKFMASAAAMHRVKLVGPDGTEHEIDAPEDMYILEAAEAAGLELPYSCRAGTCSTCTGKMASGEVDQSEGTFLDEAQMAAGYVLTCISYPKADCVIHTHKEEELH